MATTGKTLPTTVLRLYKLQGPKCPVLSQRVSSLSEYLDAFSFIKSATEPFWFRGHAKLSYKVVPSALRYPTNAERAKALALLDEFRRYAEYRLEKPPATTDKLKWLQLAQHYGLPTRLLDWTQSAVVALYFACCSQPTEDGLVLVLNPADLNKETHYKERRVFDATADASIIDPYLLFGPDEMPSGEKAIAIYPSWNSQRIIMQQGAFTLSGSKQFELTSSQASSLVALPILKHVKKELMAELAIVGVTRMSIFPEHEHLCAYLREQAGL